MENIRRLGGSECLRRCARRATTGAGARRLCGIERRAGPGGRHGPAAIEPREGERGPAGALRARVAVAVEPNTMLRDPTAIAAAQKHEA